MNNDASVVLKGILAELKAVGLLVKFTPKGETPSSITCPFIIVYNDIGGEMSWIDIDDRTIVITPTGYYQYDRWDTDCIVFQLGSPDSLDKVVAYCKKRWGRVV